MNGFFLPRSATLISCNDRGFLFGDGVYEVVKALYTPSGPHIFLEDGHWSRLRRGLTQLSIDLADSVEFGELSRNLLLRNGLCGKVGEEALVYIQITRGGGSRSHASPTPPLPHNVYAFCKSFTPPSSKVYSDGVSLLCYPDRRWGGCGAKTVCLLPNTLANSAARDVSCYEALLLRPRPGSSPLFNSSTLATPCTPLPQFGEQGGPMYAAEDLLCVECSHSNVFAVLAEEDGGFSLRTHPLDNVLPGITRDAIIRRFPDSIQAKDAAKALGGPLRVREEAFSWADVLAGRVVELIVTSTGVDAIAACRVMPSPLLTPGGGEERIIGGGVPGPCARALKAAFLCWMEEERRLAEGSSARKESSIGIKPQDALTQEQWAAYDRDGFIVLDVATPSEVEKLNSRLDEIMMGKVQYGEKLLMQLDPSGNSKNSLSEATNDEALARAVSAFSLSLSLSPSCKQPLSLY